MKRLIFLKIPTHTLPDNLTKTKFKGQVLALQLKAVKDFRFQMKKNKLFSIVKDYLPDAQLLIEFTDDQMQEVYEFFRILDLVSTIDPHIPREDQ